LGPAFEFGIEVKSTFTTLGLDLKFRFYRFFEKCKKNYNITLYEWINCIFSRVKRERDPSLYYH
jgi:hypothetical protein